MEAYATVSQVEALFRPLSNDEKLRCEALLPVVSDLLRQEALNRGKNIDDMRLEGKLLESTLISVVVDVVTRQLLTSTSAEPMTNVSESGNGFTFSGTFLNPGGGIFIKKSELSRLGLTRSRVEAWNMLGGK